MADTTDKLQRRAALPRQARGIAFAQLDAAIGELKAELAQGGYADHDGAAVDYAVDRTVEVLREASPRPATIGGSRKMAAAWGCVGLVYMKAGDAESAGYAFELAAREALALLARMDALATTRGDGPYELSAAALRTLTIDQCIMCGRARREDDGA